MNYSKSASVSVKDLFGKEPDPISWVVNDFIATGLGLIIGPSKTGKSWMALQLALAVSEGEDFLGFHARKGNVLYLALEDTERRLVERTGRLLKGKDVPEGLRVRFEASCLPLLLEELDKEIKESNPSLVIIDTLQMVRGAMKSYDNLYAYDYREMSLLKRFADERDIAIVAIHHTRKMNDASNVFNNISGSTGIMGAADSCFVLSKEKGRNKALLSVTGRDIEKEDYLISFDSQACLWSMEETKEAEMERELVASFEGSPLIALLKAKALPFEASASELADEIYEKTKATVSVYEIANSIQRYERLMRERLHIVHRSERTSSKRLHVFEKEESANG